MSAAPGVANVPPEALEAARTALAQTMGLGASLVAAGMPLCHLHDAHGARAVDVRIVRDHDAFHSAVRGALPGIAPEQVDALWQPVRQAPALQLAYEVLFVRALDALQGLLTYPDDVLFDGAERAILAQADAARKSETRAIWLGGARPHAVTGIVKITRLCNLRCSYCHDWRTGPGANMAFGVRAAAVDWLLRGSQAQTVKIVLHGGEPTLVGERGLLVLLALAARARQPRQRISVCMQTNATRLGEGMRAILRRFGIVASVSMDGPPEVHDRTRKDVKGRVTSDAVRRNTRALKADGTLGGVLMVVTPALIDAGAARLVDFMLEDGLDHVGLLPMRPAAGAPVDGAGCLPLARYCDFLLEIEALRRERAPWLQVRELDAMLAALAHDTPRTCELQGQCVGNYFAIEPDGSVSHCDKYLGDPRYVIGRVDQPFGDIVAGPAIDTLRRGAAAAKERKAGCSWWTRCKGWCPHEDYVARSAGQAPQCCGLAPLLAGLAALPAREPERGEHAA